MRAILEVVARENAEKVQSALYRIAELASAAEDMQEFYRAIHEVVGELMFASNFYIALWDEQRQLINYPYYVDEITDADDLPDPHQWYAVRTDEGRGVTAYVLRTGEPQLIDSERYQSLIEQDEIVALGITTEESSWLGVPLDADRETVGVLAVQSYTAEHQYTEHDRDLLAFVGQHVGAALSRARAIEETRQRNAELAVINSVQEALAGELEMQAIYDASATGSRRSSTPRSSRSRRSTRRRGSRTTRTSSSAANGCTRSRICPPASSNTCWRLGSRCCSSRTSPTRPSDTAARLWSARWPSRSSSCRSSSAARRQA